MKRSFFLSVAFLLTLGMGTAFSQSITGSWHLADLKEVVTNKNSGEKEDVSLSDDVKELKDMIQYDCVFNADHTMIFTITVKNSKPLVGHGTYTFEGGKLTTKTDMYKEFKGSASTNPASTNPVSGIPNFATIKFVGGNMIWHFEMDMQEEKMKLHTEIDWIWHRK